MMGGQQIWHCLSIYEIMEVHHSTPAKKTVVLLLQGVHSKKLTNLNLFIYWIFSWNTLKYIRTGMEMALQN
jgi:hypothetical protein